MDRRPELRRKLREISRGRDARTLVIAVPGVGVPAPEDWRNGSDQTWLESMPDESLPDPAIYAFDHGLDPEGSCTWTDVFEQGSELLEALMLLKDEDPDQIRSCPTVFVAHSNGGIILKSALCLAFQHGSQLHAFTNAIAAIILMGTPHSRLESDRCWNNAQVLLRLRNRYRKRQTILKEDARRLAKLSTQFEEIASDLPILSLSESIATPLKGLPFQNLKVKLTANGMARTGSRLEEHLEVSTDHCNLCKIKPAGKEFHVIKQFLHPAIENAQDRILQNIGEYRSPPVLDESTLASIPSTTPPDEVQQGMTQRATFNTTPGKDILPELSFVRRDPRLPCHMIPFTRNKDFSGRRDVLDELEEILLPQLSNQSTEDLRGENLLSFALCGPGGMGKTQIALEFCSSHMDDYDAIFWLHADEAQILASDFSRIAIELGLVPDASQDAKDLDITREMVKGWLAKPVRSYKRLENGPDEEASWLLVFDNLSNPDLLTDFWPPNGSTGSILITSRDPLAKTKVYNSTHGRAVEPLSTTDAISLLLKATWRENEASEHSWADKVVQRLDRFPLAIVQMAGVMIRQDLSFHEFVSRYDEEEAHQELFSLSFENRHRPEAYLHTIASVWALQGLSHSSGLLSVLSFFDPDGISERMLEAAVGKACTPGYPQTMTEYQKARSELWESSLISKHRESQTITVHRLIQDAARAKLEPESFTNSFATASFVVLNAWPSAGFAIRQSIARWKDCEELCPHITRLKNRFERSSGPVRSVLVRNLHFAELLNELGWYHQERGMNEPAIACFELAQKNLYSFLDNPKSASAAEDVSKARFLLAETHRNMGCNAAEINEAKLARLNFQIYNAMMCKESKASASPNDPRLAISYFELATAHIMLEEWEESMRCNHAALDEAAKLEDGVKATSTRTLTLTNLACAFLLTGRAEEALGHASTALQERKALYGPNDRQSMITGRVLHALGNIHAALGDADASYQFHRRALVHFQETVGNYHHRTADMCCKTAAHLVERGELEEALALVNQGLAIYRNQYHYRGERARAYWVKQVVHKALSQEEEARMALGSAFRLYRDVKPEDARSNGELKERDYDSVVHYWSR